MCDRVVSNNNLVGATDPFLGLLDSRGNLSGARTGWMNIHKQKYHWSPLEPPFIPGDFFLWNELWDLHSTVHKIIPRKMFSEMKTELWRMNCKNAQGFCWFLYEDWYSTTGHHWITKEFVKRAQDISQNNSPIIFCEPGEKRFHTLIAAI